MFVWQDGPRAYLVASDNIELTDVDIFDITDPRNPVQVGDHDLMSSSRRSSPASDANGERPLPPRHGGEAHRRTAGLLADYWDAGYVQMDVSDPAQPALINDTRSRARTRCCRAPG